MILEEFMDDVIDLNIDFEFKSHSIKNWFNDNYFICLYDKLGNFIHSFETIEEVAHFFNQSLKYVVQSIKNNRCMEYDHKRYIK